MGLPCEPSTPPSPTMTRIPCWVHSAHASHFLPSGRPLAGSPLNMTAMARTTNEAIISTTSCRIQYTPLSHVAPILRSDIDRAESSCLYFRVLCVNRYESHTLPTIARGELVQCNVWMTRCPSAPRNPFLIIVNLGIDVRTVTVSGPSWTEDTTHGRLTVRSGA